MAQTDQQRQDSLIITSTVLTVLSAIAVITRLVIRGIIIRKPGMDDYMILGALLCTLAYLIEIFISKNNKIGFPMDTLTLDNMITLLKTTLAIEVTYYANVTFIKISILCMYLRFAVDNTLRIATLSTIAFHAVFFIVCISGTLAQCQPLHKMWDLVGAVEGSCINTTAFFYFTSGMNILTDVFILVLPIKTLMGINRPTKEKVALLAIFTVGTFATITSIIRLHSIYRYTEAEDPFRDGILVNLWSMIEVNVGIICASVPALKPLFTPHKLKQMSRPSGYQYHDKDRSGYAVAGSKNGETKKGGSYHMESILSPKEAKTNASDSTDVILQP